MKFDPPFFFVRGFGKIKVLIIILGEFEKSITFWVIFYEKLVLYFGEVMGDFFNLVSFHRGFSFSKSTKSFKSYSH